MRQFWYRKEWCVTTQAQKVQREHGRMTTYDLVHFQPVKPSHFCLRNPRMETRSIAGTRTLSAKDTNRQNEETSLCKIHWWHARMGHNIEDKRTDRVQTCDRSNVNSAHRNGRNGHASCEGRKFVHGSTRGNHTSGPRSIWGCKIHPGRNLVQSIPPRSSKWHKSSHYKINQAPSISYYFR